MARWRLREKHYLIIRTLPDGTDVVWEQKETSQQTGRSMRKLYPVPMFLDPDPNSPGDHNYPGQVIVCWEDKGQPADYVFEGEPTPDMEPLDDEAKKVSASLKDKWIHPIESLEGGFSATIMTRLEALMAKVAIQPPAPANSDMAKLTQMVESMQEEIAQLRAERAAAEEPLEELEEA